jgi:hypothetical protein
MKWNANTEACHPLYNFTIKLSDCRFIGQVLFASTNIGDFLFTTVFRTDTVTEEVRLITWFE